MSHDFKHLVLGTQAWLRGEKPKLIVKNEFGQLGHYRKKEDVLINPNAKICAADLTSLTQKNIGRLTVIYSGSQGEDSKTELTWETAKTFVESTLIDGMNSVYEVAELPGTTREKVYHQLAIPLRREVALTNLEVDF